MNDGDVTNFAMKRGIIPYAHSEQYQVQGLLTLFMPRRCYPKSGQARREERSLVIPNEREPAPRAQRVLWARATRPGRFWGATRRDGAILSRYGVAVRLWTASTRRSRRLVSHQNGLRRRGMDSVNRP